MLREQNWADIYILFCLLKREVLMNVVHYRIRHGWWIFSLSSTVIMASSIKVFQFNQKFHQTIGFYLPQPNQNKLSLNLENKIVLIVFTQYGLTVGAYLVFEANRIADYTFGFIGLSSIAHSILIYMLFLWQLGNTLEFFENCEKFIEKSMYGADYQHRTYFDN